MGKNLESVRVKALTPFKTERGDPTLLGVFPFSDLAAFYKDVSLKISAKHGDYCVENTETTSENNVWLDSLRMTRNLTGLAFPGGFKIPHDLNDKLQCSEEMSTTIR